MPPGRRAPRGQCDRGGPARAPARPEAVQKAIEKALERKADRAAGRISVRVEVDDGVVTLDGAVYAWAAKRASAGAAGHAPGVRVVRDNLRIQPFG